MAGFTYIGRATWGANPLTVQQGYAVPLEQIVGLAVHHTVIVMTDYDHDSMVAGDLDDACEYMQRLQRVRPDLGLEVPYSFVIFEGEDPDDIIIGEGRGWGRTGAHTVNFNSTRYGCSLAGDYTAREPTPGQWAAIRWIGSQLADPVNAQPTGGHRDFPPAQTACPGNSAYPLLHLVQPPFAAPTSGDDDLTPEEHEWLKNLHARMSELKADRPLQQSGDIVHAGNLLGKIQTSLKSTADDLVKRLKG